MSKLDTYIFKNLLGPFLFFTIVLTLVVWLTQSLRFVDLIVNKGLSVTFFLKLTILVIPGVFGIILPVAVFAAILYCYQRLHSDSELVVIWSAGVSNLRVTRPALIFVLLVTSFAYGLSLYFVPAGNRAFKELQVELRTNISYVPLQEGAFNTITKGLTVYLRARKPSGELLGILVHDNRDANRPVTMMAERGALVRTDAGPQFILKNGNRQQMDRSGDKLSILYFESYNLDLTQFIKKENYRWRKPKERFIHELLWIDENNPNDRKNRGRLWSTGHDQLTSPLYGLAFTLIALALLLTGEFNRRGRGRRVIIAIALVMAVRLAGLAAVNVAAQTIALTPLIYLNVLLPIAIGGVVLLRERRTSGGFFSLLVGAR